MNRFIQCIHTLGMAHKFCTEEGTWFRHPESNLIWSNYTTCVDVEDLEVNEIMVFDYFLYQLIEDEMLPLRQEYYEFSLVNLLKEITKA